MPRPPFCFARPYHLLLSPFSLLPSRVSSSTALAIFSTDPSLHGILVTRAALPPLDRPPSRSSFLFLFLFLFFLDETSGSFRDFETNGTKRFDCARVTYDTIFGARLMDNGNGEEWRNRSQASRGHCCVLVHEYKADDRPTGGLWPTHPLDSGHRPVQVPFHRGGSPVVS